MIHGSLDVSSHYRYEYDRRKVLSVIRDILDKNHYITRFSIIEAVHDIIGFVNPPKDPYPAFEGEIEQLKKDAPALDITELSQALLRTFSDALSKKSIGVSCVTGVFVSPNKQYNPFAVSREDLSDCLSESERMIDDLRKTYEANGLDSSTIDDPVWCLWPEIVSNMTN